VTWSAGHYAGKQSEYFVEVKAGAQAFSCALGATKSTIDTLKQLAGALEPANRKPIQDIITRVTAAFQTA
jgi:hypothetical protein